MADGLEQWAQDLTGGRYAPATIKARVSAVRSAAAWAGVEPQDLTRGDIVAWLGSQRAQWTRVKYLQHVSAWCAWLGRPELTAGMRGDPQPAGIPNPVDEDALYRMLAAATTLRERCWVVLGAYAGLRACESARVCAGDLQVRGGQAVLSIEGKGGQLGWVPAADIVVEVLQQAGAGREPGARLWPVATSDTVQAAVKRVAARVGVSCTSHQLRHRYGTVLYQQTGDLRLTQEGMRHRSPVTTAGYTQVAPSELAAAVNGLPMPTGGGRRNHLRLVR